MVQAHVFLVGVGLLHEAATWSQILIPFTLSRELQFLIFSIFYFNRKYRIRMFGVILKLLIVYKISKIILVFITV